MCTLTVTYDSDNALAIKMIELMRASGVFSFPTEREEELSGATNIFSRIPTSYEDALHMGAKDIEIVREDLHNYVEGLAKEYKLQ